MTATLLGILILFFGEDVAFALPVPVSTRWTIVFSALLLASLEEVIFRYFLLNFLWKKFNFPVAVVVSALLFGLVHLNRDMGAAINATVLSIFLSFIYFEKRKLYPLIWIHTVSNLSLGWADGYSIYLNMWHLPAVSTKMTTSPSLLGMLLIGDIIVIASPWFASLIYLLWYIKFKKLTSGK
ncbi:CPBP family intramembrane metalloprotease [Undibacterium sp. CY18W]|uniref:CPBP family intramembrane metalloprotease n=1 Tax=Undibacterium hunanense TaxID=2762292 RepID=A0ABR6ZX17_9BURK|nr:CPBP family intramembrane glutamic endopeptidase [Undibacterium hunanense]MBC3920395.1 CPBP family intramembrane metalloprotease [Undibacterium hunanense]